jgi:DHA2 family multidrug resistance protein
MISWKNPALVDPKGEAYKWVVFSVMTILLFLTMFAIIPSAVGSLVIQGHFALSDSENDWVNTATLLGLVCSVPLSEHFARKKGFKLMIFLGTALFAIAFLLACMAQNYAMLILTRIMNGVGSGIFVPISLTMLTRAFPPKQLSFAIALYSALGYGCGVSVAFGLGGVMAQYCSWYYPFLMTTLISVIPLIGIWLVVQETEPEKIHPFDFSGYFAYIFWLCTLIVIVVSGKAPWNTEGWYSDFIRACYLILAIGFITFISIELTAEFPLFNLRLFKIRPFAIGNTMLFCVGAIYFATSLGFPAMLQQVFRHEKLSSGIYLILHGLAVGIGSGFVGFMIKKIGMRIPLLLGGVVLSLSCFIQMYLSIYSAPGFILFLLFFRGFGVGLCIGPVTALALRRVEPNDVPNATMIVTLCRQTGATVAGSVVTIFAVQRGAFHRARFFENVGEKTVQYMNTLFHNRTQIYTDLGRIPEMAMHEANGRIVNVIERQAALAGINDGYFALGVVIFFMTCVIAIAMLIMKLKGKLVDVNN